jgi:hypothetical protein
LPTKASISTKAIISLELEGLSEKFAGLGEKTIVWTTIFGVTLCLAAIELLDQFLKGSELLGKLIHAGIYVQNNQPEPRLWFVILLGFLSVAVVTLTVLLIHAKLNRKTEKALQQSYDSIEKSHHRAQACITGMMDAASHIRAQQAPDASHVIKTFERVRLVYRISKDFSAEILRDYTIRAADQPLNFWQIVITPSGYAKPMEYLNDINFRIRDITTPGSPIPVTYLQTENQPLQKSVCVYFLPQLEPQQRRTLQIYCKWPGYFLEIKNKTREMLEYSCNSADTTQSVRIEIYLEDGSGGTLSCEVLNRLHKHTMNPAEDPDTAWKGYVYEATNLAAGTHEHQIIAQWNPV